MSADAQSNAAAPNARTFIVVWLGQLVSLVGSGLTGFAIGVWAYTETGSVSSYATVWLCLSVPRILISPVAGVLVDRWDRRWAMILSSCGSALCTLFIAVLLFSGRLQIWHVYLAMAGIALCDGIHWPAYRAATTLLVPARHLGRANGAIEFAQATSQILAPAVAGVLILTIKLQGVVLIDFVTFVVAVTMLASVSFPPARGNVPANPARPLHEALSSWQYIKTRRGLLGLLIFFAVTNFAQGMVMVLFTPMVLSFASAAALGVMVSIAGGGMVVGSIAMSAWGGPTRRVYGVLNFQILAGVFMIIAGLRPALPLIAVAAFGFLFTIPIINACNHAIWQTQVAPHLQGRVFAMRQMISWAFMPLAYLIAGPLADRVFEPSMRAGGLLATTLGRAIGTGPGRGIAAMFIFAGALMILTTLMAYCARRIRRVDDEPADLSPSEEWRTAVSLQNAT